MVTLKVPVDSVAQDNYNCAIMPSNDLFYLTIAEVGPCYVTGNCRR